MTPLLEMKKKSMVGWITKTEGDCSKGVREAATPCSTKSAPAHPHTHTQTHSEHRACNAGVSCAEKHSFLPLQSVHAPLPNPSRGEVAWAQKKHKSVQIYGQAVAGRAIHRDSLTLNKNWPESKLWLWRVDGVCCSWSNQGDVSIYDSGSCGRLRQTGVQTDWRTDRRSSSRFSAYLFFQRACQAAEELLMQTEKASGRYFLILLFFFLFSFCLQRRSKRSSIRRPKEWPERSGGQGTAGLRLSPPRTSFLSPSLPPCQLLQDRLMEKRWWLKNKEAGGAARLRGCCEQNKGWWEEL